MRKIWNKVFSNDHSILINSLLFTLLLMLLYLLVLLPFVIYFFVQNPNIFQEADAEIYLNKNELYQFASSMELYSNFLAVGSVCELVRRRLSTKVSIFTSTYLMSYILIVIFKSIQLLAMAIMIWG